MARIHDFVFDCGHPASPARFWASTLDGYAVAPYHEAELERLRSQGIYSTDDDPGVMVNGPPGAPRIYCQLVPEPKQVKNRVHVDPRSDNHEAEAAQMVDAGARVLRTFDNFIVMSDLRATSSVSRGDVLEYSHDGVLRPLRTSGPRS